MINWLKKIVYLRGLISAVSVLLFIESTQYFSPEITAPAAAILQMAFLFLSIFFYAAYRVRHFYPMKYGMYFYWLLNTPWNCRKPLPLGPWYFTLQDIFLLSIVSAFIYYKNSIWLYGTPLHFNSIYYTAPFFLFFFVYSSGSLIALLKAGKTRYCIATLFLLAAAVRLFPIYNIYAFYAFAMAAFIIVHIGLAQALKEFPWKFYDKPKPNFAGLDLNALLMFGRKALYEDVASMGFPVTATNPKKADCVLSPENRAILAVFITYVFYLICNNAYSEDKPTQGLRLAPFIITFFFAIYRIATYLQVNGVMAAPPLPFSYRLLKLKIIIPRYHQIFVAPIIAVLASFCVPKFLIDNFNAGIVFSCTISLLFCLLILFFMSPDLHTWQMTGLYRPLPSSLSAIRLGQVSKK